MKTSNLVVWCAAGLLPVAAFAQSTEDEGFLGTIVLAYPTVPGLAEDAISVTSEGIALSNPSDLSELFVAEPTIAVGSSIPMSQKVYVNGIEENNLAISIDGARQNNKIFHHNTTTLIDPALLNTVRIDPGVAPADAGPGALGGALAYETMDAGDLLAVGQTFGGRFKTEYDTNGAIFSNSLTAYGIEGGFEYLGFLKYATGDVREDGDGQDIIGSGTDLLSGLAKVAYETEGGSRLELSVEQVSDDENRPYRANIGAVFGGRPVPSERPYDLERTNVILSYTETVADGLWDPTFRLAYSGTELFNDESNLSTAQTTYGETSSLSGEISNRFDLGWGAVNAGLDFYSDQADLEYDDLTTAGIDQTAREKLSNVGLFGQLRMEPSDMTRLSLGLRADFQDFEGIDDYTQSEAGLSGNISGELFATDQLTLSAGYAHVWGGMELAENYILNPAWSYTPDGITPVTSDSVFLAASYDFGGWVVDGKVFNTEINNARSASYNGGPSLTTDVASRGVELGLGTAWEGGFLRLGYAHVDTEVNGRAADSYTGNYLTMPMGDFLTVQAAHQFGNGILVGGDVQVAFDYDDTYDSATGGSGPTLPGYTVVNAFMEYTPSEVEGLTLRAEVNNLFDESYTSRATYGQEFAGQVETLQEPGRSFRISAEFVF
ncbi:hemoglobin/transferrin/lactoferrin receptor protein [Monaibacterium marinum]|uniref:Hemoglobin/transferrin/lactoferrin receptor protein n=1 Tax=Pontivivens marinum TaxID=1690039 RepID=A0A2C9CQI4_9RHOB|nr:TonB-dependent receptor [Monaibacterium marinum]SOH93811.1 hemoglobin/transferrin/lactoferrin receptor protein [Monaibacterium marinum]